MGPARVANPERDVSVGDEVSRAERDGVCEFALYVCDCAGVFVHVVSFQVGYFLVFLELGVGDVVFRVFLGAGDEEYTDRGDDGARLEEALVVEEVYG